MLWLVIRIRSICLFLQGCANKFKPNMCSLGFCDSYIFLSKKRKEILKWISVFGHIFRDTRVSWIQVNKSKLKFHFFKLNFCDNCFNYYFFRRKFRKHICFYHYGSWGRGLGSHKVILSLLPPHPTPPSPSPLSRSNLLLIVPRRCFHCGTISSLLCGVALLGPVVQS